MATRTCIYAYILGYAINVCNVTFSAS